VPAITVARPSQDALPNEHASKRKGSVEMSVTSMVPSSGNQPTGRNQQQMARRGEEMDPFLAFRREVDRVFDDLLRGFGVPSLPAASPGGMLTPRMDVSETDQEIRITAELPGIDEKDVEVIVADDVLTIRGQKETQREDEDRDYRLVERASGYFSRTLRLPFSVDPNKVQATVNNGVLTVTIPKPKEVQDKTQRIEVQRENGAGGSSTSATSAGSSGSSSSGSGSSGSQQSSKGNKGSQAAAG
jgi:HSP20 family protein